MLRYNYYKNTYNSIKYGGAETAVEPPIIYRLNNGQRFSGPSVQLYPYHNYYEHPNHRPNPNYDVTVYRTEFSAIHKYDDEIYRDIGIRDHPPILFEGRAYWNEETHTLDPIKGCDVKAYDCHGNWFIGRAKRIILRDFESDYFRGYASIENFRHGTSSDRSLKDFDVIIPDAYYLVQNNMQDEERALGSNVSGIVDFDVDQSRYSVQYSNSELENLCEDQIEIIKSTLGLDSPTMSRGPESHIPSPVSSSSSVASSVPAHTSPNSVVAPSSVPAHTSQNSVVASPSSVPAQQTVTTPPSNCCSISGGAEEQTYNVFRYI
jgi:hypothetical protein